MRIIWGKRAETDLFLSIGFITKENPINAEKVLVEIIELSKSLSDSPYKYPKEPIYSDENVRVVPIYSYKMIYKIYPNKIRILRLFHVKQNPKKI